MVRGGMVILLKTEDGLDMVKVDGTNIVGWIE